MNGHLFKLTMRRWRSRALALVLVFCSVFALAVACDRSSASRSDASSDPVAIAQAAPSPDLGLGINLSGIWDWTTQQPFLDAMKFSRHWMPHCVAGEPGCQGEWATSEDNLIDLDEHGWVKSLPAPEDPPEFTRVGTLIFREIEGLYPGGQYVVLYEGEGTLDYGFDAQKDVAASRPGRDVINVTPSNAGIHLMVTSTDPNKTGNYIRNIHVVPIGAEETFTTDIFDPRFVEKLQNFQAIRFMDWMMTNQSQEVEWDNRPQVEDHTYSIQGAPIEVMVAFANRISADPWFCMPHMATDEYVRNFAQLVKEQLDPALKVYVELSNEVWNWSFPQSQYALAQGRERWNVEGDAFMQWYGMRAAQMADIWKEVFADQPDRVVAIMGTQTVWRGLENAALDCPLWVAEGNTPCYHHVDAYAIAGYFGGNLYRQDTDVQEFESWLEDPDGGFAKTATQIAEGTLLPAGDYDDSLPGVRDLFNYHAQVAQERGLSLFVYEGGQHLAAPDNDRLTEFLIELNRRPEMYDLYLQLLNEWKEAGGSLFMHYSDIYRPNRWGSWGALEHVDQEGSPKYDALIDFLAENF